MLTAKNMIELWLVIKYDTGKPLQNLASLTQLLWLVIKYDAGKPTASQSQRQMRLWLVIKYDAGKPNCQTGQPRICCGWLLNTMQVNPDYASCFAKIRLWLVYNIE